MSSVAPAPTVRRRWFAAGAAAVALVGLVLIGVRTYQRLQAADSKLALPFDADAAMNLAGQQVPVEIESFYFFIFDTPTAVHEDAVELAQKMETAAVEHDYLGITGPDPDRNLDTLLRALESSRGKDLRGLVVIYLGPPDHQRRLTMPVTQTGAEFLFVEFPQGASI